MTAVEHSIIEAVRAIDNLRVEYRAAIAERDMLRRRLAELEADRDSWRARASR